MSTEHNFRRGGASVDVGGQHGQSKPAPSMVDRDTGRGFSVHVPTGRVEVGVGESPSISRSGTHTRTIREDDGLVEVNGMRTSPDVAKRIMESRGQTGSIPGGPGESTQRHQGPAAPNGEVDQNAAQEASQESSEAVSQQGDQDTDQAAQLEAMEAINEAVSTSDQRAAVQTIIDQYVAHGGEGAMANSADYLGQLSASLGLHADKVQEASTRVFDGLVNEAAQFVSKEGVDPMGFAEWARTTHPQEFAQAAFAQATAGNFEGWTSLLQRYQSTGQAQTYSAEDILNADLGPNVTVYRGENDTILVDIAGRPTTDWDTAVRNGWITVSRR